MQGEWANTFGLANFLLVWQGEQLSGRWLMAVLLPVPGGNTNETKLHSIPPCSTDHGEVKEDPQENDPAGLFSWEYFNLLSSNCIIFKLRTHICLC